MSEFPRRKGEVMQSPGSEGWTVYEPESDSLHVLNATAKAIWELCDGRTRPSEIALAISELTDLSVEEASRNVSETLDQLESLGLAST